MSAVCEAPPLARAPARPRTACRRVLFISYPFPPVGGAGVQRTVKFVKYLAEHGWQASVLTVANPSVPVLDHSLAAEVPPETIVCRARTLEPAYRVKATVAESDGGGRRPGAPGRLARGLARRFAKGLLQP